MNTPYVDWDKNLLALKSKVREGNAKGLRPHLQKQLISTTEDLGDRLVRYTITTDSVDRQNDTVSIDGWDLTPYKSNPVVLWGHNASNLPVGKCVELTQVGNALKAVVDFVPLDMPVVGQLAEAVLRMSRTGFLSATSVGFKALDYEIDNDRDDPESWFPALNFLRQELLEFSIVTIPANPEALIDPDERRNGLSVEQVNQMITDAAAQAVRVHEAELLAARTRAHRLARLRAFT